MFRVPFYSLSVDKDVSLRIIRDLSSKLNSQEKYNKKGNPIRWHCMHPSMNEESDNDEDDKDVLGNVHRVVDFKHKLSVVEIKIPTPYGPNIPRYYSDKEVPELKDHYENIKNEKYKCRKSLHNRIYTCDIRQSDTEPNIQQPYTKLSIEMDIYLHEIAECDSGHCSFIYDDILECWVDKEGINDMGENFALLVLDFKGYFDVKEYPHNYTNDICPECKDNRYLCDPNYCIMCHCCMRKMKKLKKNNPICRMCGITNLCRRCAVAYQNPCPNDHKLVWNHKTEKYSDCDCVKRGHRKIICNDCFSTTLEPEIRDYEPQDFGYSSTNPKYRRSRFIRRENNARKRRRRAHMKKYIGVLNEVKGIISLKNFFSTHKTTTYKIVKKSDNDYDISPYNEYIDCLVQAYKT